MTMPTKAQNPSPGPRGADDRLALRAAIGEHVLRALGRPVDLVRVQVRRLWADRYRVNVLVGADASAVTIAHSFFVVADESGAVQAAEPPLTQRYQP
jgi:hypothetical protein